MAITAGLTLTSGADDLLSDALSLSITTSLTKASTSTALSNTTGLARKTTSSNSQYTLFTAANFTDDGANKIYLKNMSSTASEYFTIHLGDIEMGRLYAGDFAFFPWNADTGTDPDADVKITPSVSTAITLEHMLINE